jgi:dihydrofolate synthase/folylpolyglutamate synthase
MGDERYAVLLGRLYAARRAGVELSLGRMRHCLSALGHPERRIGHIVQIGGTNGKGSTAAFVESMLRHAGVRTGLYSSPHLLRFAERIAVAGEPADRDALVAADEAVSGAAGAEHLTFFERVTAMALWHFGRAGVEVAVLEVGLGGRLDATTAAPADVAAVTGVALDHQEYLGNSIAAIAAEKAAIFRRGQPGVVGQAGEPEARALLVTQALAAGCSSVRSCDPLPGALPGPELPAGCQLGLAGPHQGANARCALAVLEALAEAGGRPVSPAARAAGLAAARLPGRLEQVASAPALYLDGAHNPDGALALCRALHGLPVRAWVLVLGVAGDKDLPGIARALLPVHCVVATAAPVERALPAAALAGALRAIAPEQAVEQVDDVAAALARAQALARDAGPDVGVVVAGSLMLVGAARQVLLGAAADPLPLTDPLGPRALR